VLFLGPPQQSCGATFRSSLFARPCGLTALVCGFAALLHIARPNRSSALRPAFDKNFKLVKAFFKGIALAMAEKNNDE